VQKNNARPVGQWRRAVKPAFLAALGLAALAVTFLIVKEVESSRLQARHFSEMARTLTYRVEQGPSAAIRFPGNGPFDERLGYSLLPGFVERLAAKDFVVDAQARLSPTLLDLTGRGYFAPYREKTQAGLQILDCNGETLFLARHPERVYPRFDAIPPLVLNTLLFIENRELLDTEHPTRNPAVEWTRLVKALMSQAVKVVDSDYDVPGGSTLATQIEKFRHSPEGITTSAGEKLRQMMSASLRAYSGGEDTLPARRQIVLDYLNTVPLSAIAGYGEVNGLGDGLWAWYGADFDRINQALARPASKGSALLDQARAFRQVLSLMIAHRRPSYLLANGRAHLSALTDSYLRLLAQGNVISKELRDAALGARVDFRDPQLDPALVASAPGKTASVVRGRLSSMLDVPIYTLDRLDLGVKSTLDRELQDTLTATLLQLADPRYTKAAGLVGEHLLTARGEGDVYYSFTLFERGRYANRVRVQTDNFDHPLDINEGTKLELGSTAKLRTLATYLDIIETLHRRYAGLPPAELRKADVDRQDRLSRWAVDYLLSTPDKSLSAMLKAAMDRRYSADPGESFFTGGGVHVFENFKREDNFKTPTVAEALRDSVNLAYIRIMRDVVRYYIYQPGSTARLLQAQASPERAVYLSRFADREGRVFVQRFYHKYHGRPPEDALAALLAGVRPTAQRLAVIFRAVEPEAGRDAFARFLDRHGRSELSERQLAALYDAHAPGRYSLADQGYLARVHPLELWLVSYLRRNPEASLSQVIAASANERQAVYAWLFKTRHRNAQDRRIRTLLEVDAFDEIHRQWKRLGYPFERLVPSLATAIGSSGDRPAALAELMGIIVNDGVRLPTVRLEWLHFAADTPYETLMRHADTVGERVMAPEVAAVLKQALADVVQMGTARRLRGAYDLADGTEIPVGGKTGTGDNRIESYGARGQLIGSRPLNRTATFVFYIGDRHFGTLTAFVAGSKAEDYSFTSALPVQILKLLAPQILSYLDPNRPPRCGPPVNTVIAQRPPAASVAESLPTAAARAD
jgi:membrane peptidoglycan carboxypeptidase